MSKLTVSAAEICARDCSGKPASRCGVRGLAAKSPPGRPKNKAEECQKGTGNSKIIKYL